jgi:hypothetical protein
MACVLGEQGCLVVIILLVAFAAVATSLDADECTAGVLRAPPLHSPFLCCVRAKADRRAHRLARMRRERRLHESGRYIHMRLPGWIHR